MDFGQTLYCSGLFISNNTLLNSFTTQLSFAVSCMKTVPFAADGSFFDDNTPGKEGKHFKFRFLISSLEAKFKLD